MLKLLNLKTICYIILFFLFPTFSLLILSQNEIEKVMNIKSYNKKEKRTYSRHNVHLMVPLIMPETKGIDNIVTPDLAKIAVIIEAEKRWNVFSLGTPIPCSDDKGKLVAYQIPVAINVLEFPKNLSPLPSGEINNNNIKDPQLWGTDFYWTFVVSARKSDYPVPLYFPGLPPYLVTYHKAAEIAIKGLGSDKVNLKKYYWLGHRGDFFEFWAINGEKILINANTLKVESEEKVLIRKNEVVKEKDLKLKKIPNNKQKLIDIYNNQVREKWEEIFKRANNCNQ